MVSLISFNPLPHLSLGKYILSTLLRGCDALCEVNNCLGVLSSVCSSALFQSRNKAERRIAGIAPMLVALIRFFPLSFVSNIFFNSPFVFLTNYFFHLTTLVTICSS